MSTGKITKVSPKSGKNAAAVRVRRKGAALTPEERAGLVQDAAKLAIELHRDALKELERY